MTQRRRKKKSAAGTSTDCRSPALSREVHHDTAAFFRDHHNRTALLLNSPGEAQVWSCEDKNANCFGRGTDKSGGAGDWLGHQSKCLRCDWQLIKCVRNANMRRHRFY